MKSIYISFLALLAFVGCKEIVGEIDILETLTLENTSGELVTVETGVYSAELKTRSKKAYLKIISEDETYKFKFEGDFKNIKPGDFEIVVNNAEAEFVLEGSYDYSETFMEMITEQHICHKSSTGMPGTEFRYIDRIRVQESMDARLLIEDSPVTTAEIISDTDKVIERVRSVTPCM